jgi:hypothetical protein
MYTKSWLEHTKIKNVNIGETSDSTKRKNPCSPDDLPGHQKQVSRQTKRRKLSYSADDLDKSGIDDTKVEQSSVHKRINKSYFNKVCIRKVDSSTPKPYLVSLKTDSF